MKCPHCKEYEMKLSPQPLGTKAYVICINCWARTDVTFDEDQQPAAGCIYPPHKPTTISEENFRILSQQHSWDKR